MKPDLPHRKRAGLDDPCPCQSGEIFRDCCGAADGLIPRGVIIKKQVIPSRRCDEMVKYLGKQPRREAIVGTPTSQYGKLDEQKQSYRVTHDIKPGKLLPKISKIVETNFQEIIEQKFGKTLFWYQVPTVLMYSEGCWYDIHSDAENYNIQTQTWHRGLDRDFSMLLYLSDQFEGGKITFNRFGFSYKPQKGDLLLFPSDNRYVHTAERVTSGYRYAIVSFCSTLESEKKQLKPPSDAVIVNKDDAGRGANQLCRVISDVVNE